MTYPLRTVAPIRDVGFNPARMRARRIELGMTQHRLAYEVGDDCRESDIRRWETGGITPRANRFPALAIALRTSTDYLYGLTDRVTS